MSKLGGLYLFYKLCNNWYAKYADMNTKKQKIAFIFNFKRGYIIQRQA